MVQKLGGSHAARFIQFEYPVSEQFFASLFIFASHQLLQIAFYGGQIEVEKNVSEVEDDIFNHDLHINSAELKNKKRLLQV